MVTEWENRAFFAGLCILIVISVTFAACLTSGSGTGNPVPASAQPVQTSIVPASEIAEPATTQVVQPVNNGTRNKIRNQQPDGPVSVTINSARKLARVNQHGYPDGTIFVVLDITVKNNDIQDEFVFNRSSTKMVNLETKNLTTQSSNFLEKMDRPLENPIVMPTTIAPNEAITGQIIFRIYDSANYRLNIVDNDRKVLTSLPVSFDSLTTTDHPLSVTIHSVEKRYTLNDIRTAPGDVFVIINATVKNNDLPNGFYFYEGSTTLRDLVSGRNLGFSFNEKKDYGEHGVENAFILPKKIKQNEAITGKLVFATTNSNTYLLNLVDNDDTILLSRIIDAG